MSGELQTIPARHGVATFVPRGRTIKIINTYGKQVVSTWAFSLAAPPEEGDDEEEQTDAEEIEKQTEELKGKADRDTDEKVDGEVEEEFEGDAKEKVEQEVEKPKEEAAKAESKHEDPPEQAPDTPENEKSTEATSEKKQPDKKQAEKRTWASYLPSMPYRSKASGSKDAKPSAAEQKDEKAKNEAQSRAWSSYLPTGKGFSSYIPNMQVPDSKEVMSAFKASHYRDPNKSYAEQLYDFSKTPVGAGSIAAATGSGTASSIYAAYSAYTKLNPSKADQPPMEYLSLPHTRAASHSLVPEVNDTLLTNLRSPIMTLIEDTSPGAHDTLTAACDATQYATLGADKPEEHGSCAENLVLALKELNEKAGLKGTKAVGADITVNIAPTPLHLFMNAPIALDSSAQTEGSGAKGAKVTISEPTGKKRSYVRFKAERDIVIVMSACPMEIGKQNGGKCMAANFMVEEPSEEDLAASSSSVKKKAPKKLNKDSGKENKSNGKETQKEEEAPKPMPKPRGGPAKIEAVKKSAERRDSATKSTSPAPAKEEKKEEGKKPEKKEAKPDDKKGEEAGEDKGEETPKPKKKPKKLERRVATPKSEAA
ncbi:hypothetical protein BDV96DRAFT_584223 [Lophiotrema nucula]|uniref:DUF1989 domain-containing protein n=1 Tax=Lophiotrema nucula TaxID=690887 RepID=A0A6A5YU50_9PLEO|nr:hypothetical protein BDV96DRAFT_584223 [Lophiotrema nucula]